MDFFTDNKSIIFIKFFMKNIRQLTLIILLLMMGNSCKTYKNLDKVGPKINSNLISEKIQKLKPWDNIKVFEKSGNIRILEYVVTEEGVLRGFETTRTKGDLVSIRVEDIVQVQVKKVDSQKTTLFISSALIGSLLATAVIVNAIAGPR
jgi:hypothetical protein